MNIKTNTSTTSYYFIAVLEGILVMAWELLSAKMITPYYGSTLYVWASILGITLLGLALGYYIGAELIDKYDDIKKLIFINIALYAVVILIIRAMGLFFLDNFYSYGLRGGALIVSLMIVLPPIAIVSTLTILLIQCISKKIENTGKVTGRVYALSSIGCILTVFIMGFWVIPEAGINKAITGLTILTLIVPTVYFIQSKKLKYTIGLFVYAFLTILLNDYIRKEPKQSLATLKFEKTGIIGQVSVLEVRNPRLNETKRRLFINNISQSTALTTHPHLSLYPYVHKIAILSGMKPKNSNALLIGYGGGHLASELIRLGLNVDAVEIDKNIVTAAKKYFFNDKTRCNLIVDDSRHYIRTTKKKYDIIIIDISSGEIQTSYNFTREAFLELNHIMAPMCMVIINFQGYLKGEKSIAARSIFKTLKSAGFNVNTWYLNDNQITDILFVGMKELADFNKELQYSRINFCCNHSELRYPLFIDEFIPTTDAFILEDDKPLLEVLALPISEEARTASIESFLSNKLEVGIPIF